MVSEEAVEGGTADVEDFGGLDFVAFGLFEGVANAGGVEFAAAADGGDRSTGDVGGDFGGQVFGLNETCFALDEGVLDGVLEFADVTGPVIIQEEVHRFMGEPLNGPINILAGSLDEVGHEEGDVVASLPERRQDDGDDTKSIEEIFSELIVADHIAQVAVGGAEDTNVDADGFLTADAFEGALLQDAEEFDLHIG